ncbi:MAG: polysaccharide biosynthesis protein [Sedimentisphaerales bacterium]|nr:polysaccharide biosynthesis protein [Sedimentisphaerales bacterium]
MSDANTGVNFENKNEASYPAQSITGLLKYRRSLIVSAHIISFAGSLMLAFLLAKNMQFRTDWFIGQYLLLLPPIIIIKTMVFALFKQYRGWWRYVGISDLIGIAAASLLSTFVILGLWFAMLYTDTMRRTWYFQQLTEISQGVFMADMFSTILLLGGFRMIVRLYHEEFRTVEGGRLKRFLIVGAGDAGEALLREIHRMPVAQYEVIGFIDDDPVKKGANIHGIAVLGNVEQISQICRNRNIEEIAIAIPSATQRQLRRVIQVCEGTKIRFRTVPSVTDIASGRYRVSQIRDVNINDLLGRQVVELDLDSIEAFARDKTILVTGAGGSIGSEMCRQLCNFKPGLLLLIEQAENPLFYIERELNKLFGNTSIKAVVCNITDKVRVEELFDKYRPQIVIHAAAHKHVPLMELNPGEAIKNNIVGTKVAADAADKFGVASFVMISTDKAVNPTSIMGSSKRIAEMYIQDLNKTSKTHFVTVRFGNVLNSEGSVVPIFKKQIATGGPLTVTHPEMKRYFMTIPEASQLVLQAATMGKGGEIFVLDMGEPVKIVDLAKELITLSGFRPQEDIEINFTGIRPGEKLFEELSIKGENMQLTRHSKISIWKNIPTDRETLYAGIQKLVEIAKTQDYKSIVGEIKKLVPEYSGNAITNN